jgi:hypothetical protein
MVSPFDEHQSYPSDAQADNTRKFVQGAPCSLRWLRKRMTVFRETASDAMSDRTYLRRLKAEPLALAFRISRRWDVKLILPLATLVGALTLLVEGWGPALSYL